MASIKDIIIVEDDVDDLLFFEMAVTDTDLPVTIRHAKNGDLLFALLKEQVPELLFLDVYMPCQDGISCIQKIRQSKEYDNLPVVMYTSNMYNETIEECHESGANFYLVKPNSIAELTEKLKKVFSLDWQAANRTPSMLNFVI